MNWVSRSNKKIQGFHWMPIAEIEDLTFMNGEGDPEETNVIDFLELSGGTRQAKKIKFHMLTSSNDDVARVSVYNVWFADSPEALSRSVASDTPTEIICASWPYPLPLVMTFDITTRYMAINYDPVKSNHLPELASISIYAY